ncbi:MAG: leucine-rich repeat protein [Clostridia bacterium]|nr:leucine-rich repeat protein [Clostridia bacterium]
MMKLANKHIWISLAVCLIMILVSSIALADRPTGGVKPISRDAYAPRRSVYCVTTDKDTYEAGETVTFTVNFPENGSYLFSLCIYDETHGVDSYIGDTLWDPGEMTSAQFTYDMIWTPGEYWVFVNFFDADGNRVDGNGYCEFYVTECSGTNQISSMVQQIVSQNRGQNDFETLVNLYTWLMNNCEYDYNYTYYSAESAFLLGTGVCNSYSRALDLLLTEAGIPSRRVVGNGNGGGHAWNAARLDGTWALYDATWDDGGYDYYYCGLSDELMSEDHSPRNYVGGSVTCPSLRNHHWIRTGRWQNWSLCCDDDWTEYDFDQDMKDRIQGGSASFSIDYSDLKNGTIWYPIGEGSYRTCGATELYMYVTGVDIYGLTFNNQPALDLSAHFNRSTFVLDVTVLGWMNGGDGELDLPDDLTEIGERAFEGTDAANVLVPDGCLSIGNYAFSGSSVTCVTIPNAQTEIGEGAFDGCSPLMIIAPDNSPAAEYAEANSILRLRP